MVVEETKRRQEYRRREGKNPFLCSFAHFHPRQNNFQHAFPARPIKCEGAFDVGGVYSSGNKRGDERGASGDPLISQTPRLR